LFLFRLAAAVILAVVYGHDVAPTSDHFVEVAEKALATFAEATSPVGNMVNFFPSLRFLPGWLPGCGFQQRAAACRVLTKEMVDVPVDCVVNNMVSDRFHLQLARFLKHGQSAATG
jgi:hypothetical protein